MTELQAIQIIKQFLDNALKLGVCSTLEQANALAQAFRVLNEKLQKSE